MKRQAAGRATVEYQVTGDLDGSQWHFRFIGLRVGDSYCTLQCLTKPSHWVEAQPLFDGVVKNLK